MSKRSKFVVFALLLAVIGFRVNHGMIESVPVDRMHVKLELPDALVLATDVINDLPSKAAGPPESASGLGAMVSWSGDNALGSEARALNPSSSPQTIHQQCEGQPEGFDYDTFAVLQIYSAYIPAGTSVHCSRTKKMVIAGQEAYFVYIVYGDLRGCDPYCYSSQICAIYDSQTTYLFSAQWYVYEEPINLILECPDMVGEVTGNTNHSCNPKPSGFDHPAVSGTYLISLYTSTESNVFRNCFL